MSTAISKLQPGKSYVTVQDLEDTLHVSKDVASVLLKKYAKNTRTRYLNYFVKKHVIFILPSSHHFNTSCFLFLFFRCSALKLPKGAITSATLADQMIQLDNQVNQRLKRIEDLLHNLSAGGSTTTNPMLERQVSSSDSPSNASASL